MAPRTDRLTWMLAVSALALLLAASPAHGAQPESAKTAGYKQSSGGVALSKYDAATKRYLPVATDPLYSYYRINITWQIVTNDTFDPDPSNPTLWQAVRSGPVFDNPSGEKVGNFDATAIDTGATKADNGATLTSRLFHGVYELGPQGDDALMYQGSGNQYRTPTGPVYADGDNAIIGGTGQFLGASGQSLKKYARAWNAEGKALEVYEFIVPRFKSF